MNFKSWAAEAFHADQTAKRLNEVVRRRYLISKVKNKNANTVGTLPYHEVWAEVSMYAFLNDEGAHEAKLSLWISRTYYGNVQCPIAELTTEELGRVVALRQMIDLWIAGELPNLPSDSVENLPWREKLDQ